jgi:hypothetical protein
MEEVSMNANPSELVRLEEHTDVAHEAADDLVEVGAVSETKGSLLGVTNDNGNGYSFA